MTAQQLKNSILQMAVQGKLVPQDPNDEPASVLLERIRAEKERLIKEKKIKREKNPSVIFKGADNTPYEKIGDEVRSLADEVPFDIPDSWEWVRLGSAFAIEMGQSPAGNTVSGNCSGTEFHQGKVFFGEKYIKASDQYTSSPTKFAPKNSVLLCVRAPVGKVNITDRGLCIGRGLCAIIPLAGMPLLFAYYLLAAYENIFVKQATGTTFVAITAETVKNQLIPMPPLAEQQRIADLIERLIPYVDEYGKAESAVDQLNCHFPEALKKSILQEAVQGKLVPQDPSDEPAEALLDRIRAEKQRLIKEGKIKKDKHESVIFRRDNSHYEKLDGVERCIDDELLFEIPDSWEWVRLGTVLEIARGGSPRPIQQYLTTEPDGINWIKIGDTDKGGKYIYKTKEKIRPEGVAKSRMVHSGDFLLTNSMSFGRPYILKSDGCIHDGWLVLSNRFECYSVDFLYYILSSPFAYYQFCDSVSGAVVKNLNSDKVANALFPLPPLSEQKRIVQRIEELLPLVKGL